MVGCAGRTETTGHRYEGDPWDYLLSCFVSYLAMGPIALLGGAYMYDMAQPIVVTEALSRPFFCSF